MERFQEEIFGLKTQHPNAHGYKNGSKGPNHWLNDFSFGLRTQESEKVFQKIPKYTRKNLRGRLNC